MGSITSPDFLVAPGDPEHQSPPCPKCESEVGCPLVNCPRALDLKRKEDITPADLWCPACGHNWTEESAWAVAAAWWSAGAWEGAEARSRKHHARGEG